MASTITNYTTLIDVEYPKAGNNDSQGFRSNFASIKSALDVAADEISDLQLNLVNLSGINNFGGNEIRSATVVDCNIILNSYTISELSALTDSGTVENGTLVFITDTYNCPAYYNEGSWYAMPGEAIE